MSFLDAATLQQKALELIDRHLDQLLEGGPVAQGSAITIQNYAKTLAILAKDQREQNNKQNPAELTDAELDTLAKQAAELLNEEPDDASSDTLS